MDRSGQKKHKNSTSVDNHSLSLSGKLRGVSPIDGVNKTLVFTSRFVESTIIIFGKKTEK